MKVKIDKHNLNSTNLNNLKYDFFEKKNKKIKKQ